MRVVIVKRITGTRDGVEWPEVGGIMTVSDAEGAELVDNGIAVIDPSGEVESAAAKRTRAR